MITEFKKYVRKYDLKNEKTNYKFHHSFRVMKMCVFIAKKLKLSNKDRLIAKQVGLLHDIGRFEQIKLYDTYVDYKSMDHGNYGVEVLFKDDFIDKFKIKKENYNIIKKAIFNHNKKSLGESLTEKEELFCKLIRDADKIDILYSWSKEYWDVDLTDKSISNKINKDFFDHKLIDRKDPKNGIEDLINEISYIYDLNFTCSLKYIKNHKIIEKFRNKFSDKELEPYFEEAIKYINERIDKNVGAKI